MTLQCPSCAAPIEEGADACLACGRSLGTLALGSVLAGRYELRSVLGKGGMGLVYRAFDRLLEEEVAIKVLRTDFSGKADALRRFRGEIKLARKVSHPNVCRIHDYGEEGALGYISMEILTGQDFQKTLQEQPRGLPEEEALSAVLQIASGLQAIHEVGIIHRDLKTANVSRDERGMVRLVDFGIAKDLLSEGLTAAGESFGTPEYMSPEHCRGEALDFRSDVYALGVVAFELFTGEVPIRGANPMATLFKQIQDVASFDQEPGSRVPRRFVPALRRALSKSAADRYASAQEFALALRSAAIAELASVPPGPAAKSPTKEIPAPRVFKDVRKDERIHLPTDVILRKLGPGGSLQKEERTVAHDLSRSGMRILTSWSDLQEGDRVGVAEVGGDFATGAIVRNINRGTDHITRVGIEFLGSHAPDRLVGTGSIQRPAPTAARPSVASAGAKSSGPVVPPRLLGPPPIPGASRPPTLNPVTGRRERKSGRSEVVQATPPSQTLRGLLDEARKLAAESNVWQALECLSKAHDIARGPIEVKAVLIQTAETRAMNPALAQVAQQSLEDMARAEPGDLPVHAALGRVYQAAGMVGPAADAFGRVLALDPANREAAAALTALRAAHSPRE